MRLLCFLMITTLRLVSFASAYSWPPCSCINNVLSCSLDSIVVQRNVFCTGSSILSVRNMSLKYFPPILKTRGSNKCNDSNCDINEDTIHNPIFVFDISDNHVKTFSFLPKPCSLVVISFANNAISMSKNNLILCDKLEGINIAGNKLKKLNYKAFAGLKNLRILELSGNPLPSLPTSIFSDLTNLEILRIADTQIIVLQEEIFINLKKLWLLDLRNNNILFLRRDLFRNLKNLKYLYLQGNYFRILAYGLFEHQNNLINLDISYNHLYNLNEQALIGLTSLKEFRIMNNSLTVLPPMKKVCPNLLSVHMENNNITSLRESYVRPAVCGRNAISFYLAGNPVEPRTLCWTRYTPFVNIQPSKGKSSFKMVIRNCQNSTLDFSTTNYSDVNFLIDQRSVITGSVFYMYIQKTKLPDKHVISGLTTLKFYQYIPLLILTLPILGIFVLGKELIRKSSLARIESNESVVQRY